MSDTTYIDYVQPAVSAEWLNEINDHVWHDTPVTGTIVHDASKIAYLPDGISAVPTTVRSKLRSLELADYTALRAFTGNETHVQVIGTGIAGLFKVDATDTTSADNGGTVLVDASGRRWKRQGNGQIVVGAEQLSAPAIRDAFVVGRNITGLTDCHGFADRTVMNGVTDVGTYGCFDTTVKLQGSHTQNHVFGFQDRVDYQGSGTLEHQAGLYTAPKFSGSGTWQNRYGVYVLNVDKTGSGTLENNVGVYVLNQTAGTINVGINVAQTTGYTFYCGGGAKSYHAGNFGIGAGPADGVKLHVANGGGAGDVALNISSANGYAIYAAGGAKSYHKGNIQIGQAQNSDGLTLTAQGAATGPRAFLHTTETTVQVGGVGGDYPLWFINNGAVRLEITSSSGTYTVRPGSDNKQPLGDVTKRWSQLFAGTGTINTSDRREKQDIAELDEAERRVAVKLKCLVKKFRFRDAVQEKGDDARIHFGVIAQEVVSAFESESLDPMRYAIVCYDAWESKMSWVVGEDGEEHPSYTAAGDRYGIRYDELLAFIIAAL